MAKLALLGGNAVRDTQQHPWPRWPFYGNTEREGLLRVLESRNWGGFPSPNVTIAEFAAKFAKYHGAAYGVACTNGTVTLELALKAGGIKAGDEVIAPCYTWRATAGAAVYVNAVPVFADVRADNYTLDPDHVERLITPRTRAVIAVHLGSSAADNDRLLALCRKHGLLYIEDCAHSHGGMWKGKGLGAWGDFGSYSFQSSKLMTAGEGGLVTTNDKIFEEKLQSYVNCGRKLFGYDSFEGNVFGYNYRMTEFQAAVLLGQLATLDEYTRLRAENGRRLSEGLEKIPGIEVIHPDPRVTMPHHYQYIFKFKSEQFGGLKRDRFLAALDAEGVHADGTFYEPIHAKEWFRPALDEWPALKERYPEGIHAGVSETPNAFRAAYEEACWLHYSYLHASPTEIDQIVEAVAKIRANVGELMG